ncbi:MAG: hypothetical protein ACR2IO_03580 [Candidatus Nanopelagicus sp.]
MSNALIDYTRSMNWKHGSTWYRVIGDLKSKKTPAVVLHGGPGVPHNYVIGLAQLINMTGRPVVLYDQSVAEIPHISMINLKISRTLISLKKNYLCF